MRGDSMAIHKILEKKEEKRHNLAFEKAWLHIYSLLSNIDIYLVDLLSAWIAGLMPKRRSYVVGRGRWCQSFEQDSFSWHERF